MMILNESKRDDLLLPCLEILKSKGVNTTLGELKRYLLRKFVEEGDMRNLSLGSNFYLAGVARYYFNGDLTLNKDLAVFKPNPMEPDTWNKDVCKRLNALILILRNSVIDSVGETFEQPEDFGTLSVARLLKKYNRKIAQELGEDIESKDNAVLDTLNRDTAVGNDYTFEILYTPKDATKYYEPTKPGSWCITYNERYYRHYTGLIGGCHFIIFRKNGWELVKRKTGDGWSKEKPQDEYGNSLIAFLAKNADGSANLITSRWNHGQRSEGTECEADYAYTPDEFKRITGVTDADLQRIQEIWVRDKAKRSGREDNKKDRKELKERMLKALRYLKYAQMRINGGENPDNAIITIPRDVINREEYIQIRKGILSGNGKASKSIIVYKFDVEERQYVVLVDKGKIVFETLIPFENFRSNRWNGTFTYTDAVNSNGERIESRYSWVKNAIIIAYPNDTYSIYNLRTKQMVSVEGTTKFKHFENTRANYHDTGEVLFYEVCLSGRQFALINAKTNQPLVLPNGMCWYEKMSFIGKSSYYGREVKPYSIKDDTTKSDICITYEAVSNTIYLYNIQTKQFTEIKNLHLCSESDYARMEKTGIDDVYLLNSSSWRGGSSTLIKNGQELAVGPVSNFISFNREGPFYRIIIGQNPQVYYIWSDTFESFISVDGEPLLIEWSCKPYNSDLHYYCEPRDGDIFSCHIFSAQVNKFLINPMTNNTAFTLNGAMRSDVASWRNDFSKTGLIKTLNDKGEEVSYYTDYLIDNGYVKDAFIVGSAPLHPIENQENVESNNNEPALATMNEIYKLTHNDIQKMVMETVNRLLKEL